MSDYYVVDGEHLTDIADALREKTGENGNLEFPDGFTGAIGKLGLCVGTMNKVGTESNVMVIPRIQRNPVAFVLLIRVALVSQKPGAENNIITSVYWDGTTEQAGVLYADKETDEEETYGKAIITRYIYATHTWENGTLTITVGDGQRFKFADGVVYDLIYIN